MCTRGKLGLMVQAPCGSGKSFWISQYDPAGIIWLDGDQILLDHHIKNRNYFWYDVEYELERGVITSLFDWYLQQGYNILYSGNPLVLRTDVIVHIKSE